MRRRQYLGAVVAVGSGIIAGCGSLASFGGPSQDPDEVVEAYFEALNDGDREEAEALLHSESDDLDMSDQEFEFWDGVIIEILDVETVEQEGDGAVVEITWDIESAEEGVTLGGDGGSTRFTLAIEDGEWRIVTGRLL